MMKGLLGIKRAVNKALEGGGDSHGLELVGNNALDRLAFILLNSLWARTLKPFFVDSS
ncbi:hypothetical protein PM082_005123 [Marasmius tenuissimus]|nr:hypothetical protein PM082_005123 [Marasmius tenuissimus]